MARHLILIKTGRGFDAVPRKGGKRGGKGEESGNNPLGPGFRLPAVQRRDGEKHST